MMICIPTLEAKGLESFPDAHFGSAPYFVLHDTATGQMKILINHNDHHEHGACQPLKALAGQAVDAILVGGIGARAFARLSAAGTRVFQAQGGTIRDNLTALQQGQLREFTPETACHGHGHGRGHHHG